MGEPAVRSDEQRRETLAIARAIIEAVRNDEAGPLDPGGLNMLAPHEMRAWADRVDLVLFALAQDLVIANRQLAIARDVLEELERGEQRVEARVRASEALAEMEVAGVA